MSLLLYMLKVHEHVGFGDGGGGWLGCSFYIWAGWSYCNCYFFLIDPTAIVIGNSLALSSTAVVLQVMIRGSFTSSEIVL